MYPHITLAVRPSLIFNDLHRCLITLIYMHLKKVILHTFAERHQISGSNVDCPVRHILSGYMNVITFEFLLYTIERNGINKLAVENSSGQRRCNDTVLQQILRSVTTIEFILMITIRTYIYLDCMNFSNPLCWYMAETLINFIRHFFPVIRTKECIKCIF